MNAIDGTTTNEGRLLFMTVTAGNRLMKRGCEKGRMDYELEFKQQTTSKWCDVRRALMRTLKVAVGIADKAHKGCEET